MVGLIDRRPRACKACGQTKPADDFPLYSLYCQPCYKKRQADNALRNKSPFQTVEEWEAFCARYGNRCVRCGADGPLTIDHVDPFGGRFDIDNIQPLCRSCNSTKGKKYWDFRPVPTGVYYERVCPKCGGRTHTPSGYGRETLACRARRCRWQGDASLCPIVRRPTE